MLRTTILRGSLLIQLPVAVLWTLGVVQRVVGQDEGTISSPVGARVVKHCELPKNIEQVLWWVPEETEAVLVSTGNVCVRERRVWPPPGAPPTLPSGTPSPPTVVLPELLPDFEYQDIVAHSCIAPLAGGNPKLIPTDTEGKMIWSFYGRKTADLFVKAVWWNKDATRELCDVVVFRDDTGSRIIEALAAFPNTPRDVRGVRVLEVDLNHGLYGEKNRPIPFDLNELGPVRPKRRYLAAPRPNVYVNTTSVALMEIIIQRMKHKGKNRALPPDLPMWSYLDPTATAWGIRRYGRATADKDRLSMLKWDPKAQGLVFFCRSDPVQYIGLRYVSSNEDAGSRLLRMQAKWLHVPDPSSLPETRRISPNCVETRTRINVSPPEMDKRPWRTLSPEYTGISLHFAYLPWLGFSCPRVAIKGESDQ